MSADVDPPVVLATSIACLRMAARYRNLEIYSLINELCGNNTELTIPLPITTVLTREISSNDLKQSQQFHAYPLYSSTLQSALEVHLEFAHRIQRIVAARHHYDTIAKIEAIPPTNIPSQETMETIQDSSIEVSQVSQGCLSVVGASLATCLKVVWCSYLVLEDDPHVFPFLTSRPIFLSCSQLLSKKTETF
jgi:enolase